MLLPPADREAIRTTWIKRQNEDINKRQKQAKEALCRAYKVAHLLLDKYKVTQVYLYGSLARDEYFDDYSDIDIYITGWEDEKHYWIMLSEVQHVASPYPISIVTEKEALPTLKETIHKEGKLLS
jgi:predicted nucleotidyltransferase